jgi:hypothetical protein
MIEFNKVTWYSKLAAVIIFLLVIPMITFHIGREYQKTISVLETASATDVPLSSVDMGGQPVSGYVTYTNPVYKFSFSYPKSWIMTESADKTQVTIDSNAYTGEVETHPIPAVKVTISAIKKQAFKPVGTKVGDIRYDQTRDALVDAGQKTASCLQIEPFMGIDGSYHSYRYGGSTMSSPAYFDNAIITEKDYMILVHEEKDIVPDAALQAEINADKEKLYASFKLAPGDVASLPTGC